MDSNMFFDVSAALASLGYRHGERPFQGWWEQKHWMSTPGPIYCGDTDNCGTGPIEAPDHVELDEEGFQVLFRQPGNLLELQQVVLAADHDPVDGYGIDGDLHWSYETIKMWWADPRRKIEQEVRRLCEVRRKNFYDVSGLQRWLDYLQNDLYQYLQTYAFFLDTKRLPLSTDTLPDL